VLRTSSTRVAAEVVKLQGVAAQRPVAQLRCQEAAGGAGTPILPSATQNASASAHAPASARVPPFQPPTCSAMHSGTVVEPERRSQRQKRPIAYADHDADCDAAAALAAREHYNRVLSDVRFLDLRAAAPLRVWRPQEVSSASLRRDGFLEPILVACEGGEDAANISRGLLGIALPRAGLTRDNTLRIAGCSCQGEVKGWRSGVRAEGVGVERQGWHFKRCTQASVDSPAQAVHASTLLLLEDSSVISTPPLAVPMLDVATQHSGPTLPMAEWLAYLALPAGPKRNVKQLNLAHTPLARHVQAPRAVREIDFASRFAAQHEAPQVLKCLLMSPCGAWTDFHVGMCGSSVWYHVMEVRVRGW